MKRRGESTAKREARRRFREAVLESGPCVEHGGACRAGIVDPHHVVKAQLIRSTLLPLRLPERKLWAIVFDPRIGVPVCRPVHNELDGKSFRHGERRYLRPEQVPWQAIQFCREHSLMGALERAVPGLSVAEGVQ